MIILIILGVLVVLYFVAFQIAALNATPPALRGPITKEMDEYAMERFAYLMDELRDQYRERRRLLRKTPRRRRGRRKDLRQLTRIAHTRLQECKKEGTKCSE